MPATAPYQFMSALLRTLRNQAIWGVVILTLFSSGCTLLDHPANQGGTPTVNIANIGPGMSLSQAVPEKVEISERITADSSQVPGSLITASAATTSAATITSNTATTTGVDQQATAFLPTVTPAPAQVPCEQAVDITPSAEISLPIGGSLVFTWILNNTGACRWTGNYRLVMSAGDTFGAPREISMLDDVAPGTSVQIPMNITAPTIPGTYQAKWVLMNPQGVAIPTSSTIREALVIKVNVAAVATPTLLPTPSTGALMGRLTINGIPAPTGLFIRLEDSEYNKIAATAISPDGTFAFYELEPAVEDYNVVFAQADNEDYTLEQVISWGWVGPLSIKANETVWLPDFEISLLGFKPLQPAPDALLSAAGINASSPLVYGWQAYPGAQHYWVDLTQGDAQTKVWQSTLTQSVSYPFDGVLESGGVIQPGVYWWGIGAQRALGEYDLTVYSYLTAFYVEP